METGARENWSRKQRSAMLNGTMIRMQRILWISNKEANSDVLKNCFSGLVGWNLTSLNQRDWKVNNGHSDPFISNTSTGEGN